MPALLRLIAIVYSGCLIGLMYFAVLSDSRPGAMTYGPTTDIWAAAIAISQIEHGLGGGLGYQLLSTEMTKHVTSTGSDISVHDDRTRTFSADPIRVTAAFRMAAAVPKSLLPDGQIENRDYVNTWAEDIGYADFYNLAFRVFGYSAVSTYKLYFSFLVLSALLFIADYRKSRLGIGILSLSVAGLFLTSTASVFEDSVPSPAANRYLATLTLIPLGHLLLAGLDRRPLTRSHTTLLIIQCILLALTLSFRTPAAWVSLALIGTLSLAAVLFFYRHRKRRTELCAPIRNLPIEVTKPALLALMVVTMTAGYPLLRNAFLHPVYSNEAMPHHFRWHSAVLGLSIHPDWPKHKPHADLPDGGDMIAFRWFEQHLREQNLWHLRTSPKVMNLYPARLHDRVMRKKFRAFAKANKTYMLELYAWYKSVLLYDVLKAQLSRISGAAFVLTLPLLVVVTCLLSSVLPHALALSGIAAGVWLFSLLPSFWAYAASYVTAAQVWTTIMLAMIVGIAAAVSAARVVCARRRSNRTNSETQ